MHTSTPHNSGPSFINSTTPISHAPTPFLPPPPPPPRPIDEIEDDEGYISAHFSEDEEDHVIANKVDFVDFIAMTNNIIDIDEGSEQSGNKPLIWEVGMEWPNIDVLRDDIKDFCITNRFDGDLIKNDPLRIRVICLGKDRKNVQCPWVAYFRRDDDGFTMRLNTLKPIHTCQTDCDMLNRMANVNWVVRKIQDQMKTQSGIRKAKYKALRNGSDSPASDAPLSEPIAEPPSNTLAPRASCASVRAPFKAQTVVSRSRATIVEKPPVKPVEKLSVKPIQPRTNFKMLDDYFGLCEDELASYPPPGFAPKPRFAPPPPANGFDLKFAPKPAPPQPTPPTTKAHLHLLRRSPRGNEELLVVIGGGAAGVYGAIRAKTVAPHLGVLVIEKGN
ncbi:hypothetical protein IFM89_031373 [Coptis chinensis]|uniref:Uncharacterized protein n=1 Tax=Coptis chinensis TaxID=261450 RepID=A0A835MJS4_9MAGN|nr:hypothetical protein IFM89_031373 [Coptis chinensis]